jgi:ribosomal protein S3
MSDLSYVLGHMAAATSRITALETDLDAQKAHGSYLESELLRQSAVIGEQGEAIRQLTEILDRIVSMVEATGEGA